MIESPKLFKRELDKYVVGQEEAKKDLSIVLYSHYTRMKRDMEFPSMTSPPRCTVLIAGPTGTGKTLLVQTLSKRLNLPFLRIDATELTKEGFAGQSFKGKLEELYNREEGKYKSHSPNNFLLLNYTIVYIDEIDKLGGNITTTRSDNWNAEIQNNLLTAVDGADVTLERNGVILDTSKMLFIFSGAFESVLKERNNNITTGIGFKSDHDQINNEKSKPLTREDMEKAGLLKELIGRINVITYTNKLNKSEIKDVLLNCNDSIFEQYRSLFYLSGKSLKFNDLEIDSIIEEVDKSSYGMRYLKSIVHSHLKDRLFNLSVEHDTPLLTYEGLTPEEFYDSGIDGYSA